jgi:hypothetical protein
MKGRHETCPFIKIRANPPQKQNSAIDNMYQNVRAITTKTEQDDGSNINKNLHLEMGQDRVVGIATCYWLDSPRIEFLGGGQDFLHPPKSALWPTQPPAQWIPGLARGKLPGHGIYHPAPSSNKVKEK